MTHYEEDERVDGQPHLFAGLAWKYASAIRKERTTGLLDGWPTFPVESERPMAVARCGDFGYLSRTEWLWKTAYCFHKEGSRTAEEFVTHYLRMFWKAK